jgi:hypothetical protein
MLVCRKVSYFGMELTANESVALGTSGLEQVRDNWDQDSVMRISKGKVPTRWIYWLDSGRGLLRQMQRWHWLAYLYS